MPKATNIKYNNWKSRYNKGTRRYIEFSCYCSFHTAKCNHIKSPKCLFLVRFCFANSTRSITKNALQIPLPQGVVSISKGQPTAHRPIGPYTITLYSNWPFLPRAKRVIPIAVNSKLHVYIVLCGTIWELASCR